MHLLGAVAGSSRISFLRFQRQAVIPTLDDAVM